ncbi:AT-rich interactive domain-containing protein 4A [Trichoplax sp. H2]|nr:AT-rich interactive domain-containing protein 4A [Trichoplax sp. H2]|eukprot:RDD44936.1 AT-rich interactive domain-containing protein 4A [Trichoplax sp. H2]
MTSEEPAYLNIGTDVSAKYRGAFCEAKITDVRKMVRCKVNIGRNTNPVTVLDDCIVRGELKVGSEIVLQMPDDTLASGSIAKLTDASTYTVVFDDGDQRSLKRTALCLKGQRHFNESETLDHLPLTNPENFGNPVVAESKKVAKKSQRSRNDDTESESSESKKIGSNERARIAKIVMVKQNDKKRSCFPGLLQRDSDLNDDVEKCSIRSFKDGKIISVAKKDLQSLDLNYEAAINQLKSNGSAHKPALEKAITYINDGELPEDWQVTNKDGDDVVMDEEAEEFMGRLYKFMEDKGTPITKAPVLGYQTLNLYKLYKLVQKMGGMERVSQQMKWRSLYSQLGIATMITSASHNIKLAYQKYLYPYECYEYDKTADDKNSHNEDSAESAKSLEVPTSSGTLRRERYRRQRRRKEISEGDDSTDDGVASGSDVYKPIEYPGKDATNDNSDTYSVGSFVLVKYGRGKKNCQYEAKIIEWDDSDESGTTSYFVHYSGWNSRHDEWIKPDRIIQKMNPQGLSRGNKNPAKSVSLPVRQMPLRGGSQLTTNPRRNSRNGNLKTERTSPSNNRQPSGRRGRASTRNSPHYDSEVESAPSDSPTSQNTNSPADEEASHPDENTSSMEVVSYQDDEINTASSNNSPKEKVEANVEEESSEENKMEVESEEIKQDIPPNDDDDGEPAEESSHEEAEQVEVKKEPEVTEQSPETCVTTQVDQKIEDSASPEENPTIEDKPTTEEKKEESEESKTSNDDANIDENSDPVELILPRKRGNRRNGNARKRCRSDSTSVSSNDQSSKSNNDSSAKTSTSSSTVSDDNAENDLAGILNDLVVLGDLPIRKRIETLQVKLNEIRRLYNSRRAEVMSIDRKLKKYRKKAKEKAHSNGESVEIVVSAEA